MSRLKKKHVLFSSVDEMLQPEVLTVCLGQPVKETKRIPIEFQGTSGSEMEKIRINGRDTDALLVKHIFPHKDWLMHSTKDENCRSLSLWQNGILDELLPFLDHTIVAGSKDENGWAILMHDVTSNLADDDGAYTTGQIHRLLDSLAGIHATYWQRDELASNDLCDTRTFLNCCSYENACRLKIPSIIPEMIQSGWNHLDGLLQHPVLEHLYQLRDNPRPLFDAIADLPRTLTHGDYRPANIAIDRHGATNPAVFDWQLSGYTLMTIDLALFIHQIFVFSGKPLHESITYYRHRLEYHLGHSFEDKLWQKMLDLGLLAEAYRFICFWAHFSTLPEWHAIMLQVLDGYNAIIKNGVRWL